MRVLVDTNVLISAFLGQAGRTAPQQIVAAGIKGRFRPVCCDEILLEFRSVALRPKLIKLHRQGPAEVERFLQRWVQRSMHRRAPKAPLAAPDPQDQMLWDLLAADSDLLLVTGDLKLLNSRDFAGRKLSPATLLTSHLS